SRMKAKGVDPNRTVFVGCRTVEEVEYLRGWGGGSVIGLHADTSIRFKRCVARDRPNEALRLEDFVKKDMREFEMGLARVLGAAVNRFLINEGSLLDLGALAQIEIRNHIGKSK
ncbi:MAG TPA: hypothetical protein VN843_32355, partial [Anaerolineales bacterium]|nr:hypothetical protein [Anaerolineales bacterium]